MSEPKQSRGTPKGLVEAIANALVDQNMSHVSLDVVTEIRAHVLDFLAQKFNVEILKAHKDKKLESALRALWDDIKGEK